MFFWWVCWWSLPLIAASPTLSECLIAQQAGKAQGLQRPHCIWIIVYNLSYAYKIKDSFTNPLINSRGQPWLA